MADVDKEKNNSKNMANKILIIGVGSAGVIAADKMNLPNSKKLFIDADYRQLETIKSEGDKMLLECKDFGKCSSFCHCFTQPGFCKKVAEDYEEEIRECIKNAKITVTGHWSFLKE
jgi:cell division GTPase FtsZ